MTNDQAPDAPQRSRFERLMLPHLDAAYSLAFWLTRSEELARDAVQEAYLRAFRFFASFRGEDSRPWLLGIVRNACYELGNRESRGAREEFSEELHGAENTAPGAVVVLPVNPEAAVIERAERALLRACLDALPREYREVIVLREIEGCSYKEIAQIAAIPIGTVMSRRARARRLLQASVAARTKGRETGT